jgi:hypothetical protein
MSFSNIVKISKFKNATIRIGGMAHAVDRRIA